jgi:exopolyphosphatase/guanosine-5'-triphosphate,3'-diphosphate pyrophosphatase
MTRRAVIDIGTNSVKVLVADVTGRHIEPVWEIGEQTRLGRGFYETKTLQPEAIRLTAETVGRFAQRAKDLGAQSIRAVATSAARDARNAEDLCSAVKAASELSIDIISGDLEAELSFAGLQSRDSITTSVLALDVGGGSTEFMIGGPEGLAFRHSTPLGSVRLLERFKPDASPTSHDLAQTRQWLLDHLRSEELRLVAEHLAALQPTMVIGVGGTTSLLALIHHRHSTYDTDLIETTVFARAELSALVEKLWLTPLAIRQTLPGLPPERADVILFGAAIYEAVLMAYDLPHLGISTRGLRYGALVR